MNPSCFQEVNSAETGSETVFVICQPVVGLKIESQQEVIKAVERSFVIFCFCERVLFHSSDCFH